MSKFMLTAALVLGSLALVGGSARAGSGSRLDSSETEEPANLCLEEPNYYQQYPGCPFTNGCPRTDRHAPTTPEIFGKGAGEETSEDATPPAGPEAGTVKPKGLDVIATGTLLPAGSDTMEFRPSDAREGEFDKRPY